MKALIFLLYVVAVFSFSDIHEDNYHFIVGYANSINEHGDIRRLRHCINNKSELLNLTKSAVDHIRTMAESDLMVGAKEYLESTHNLVAMLRHCIHEDSQFRKVEKALHTTTVDKVYQQFIKNMGAYFHLATSAYAGFLTGNYTEAGINVGAMAKMLFLSSLTMDIDMMKEFVIGFSNGIGETKDPSSLSACIKAEDSILVNLEKSVDLIRTLATDDLNKGCKMLLDETLNLYQMLSACLNDFATFKKLLDKLRSATVAAMIRTIMGSMGTYFHLALNALEAFQGKKYKEAGKAIGILHKYLFKL